MKKKALLMVLAAVVLVAASVGGTLAWLTSTTLPVTNTFTVGDLNITLEEPRWDASKAKIVPNTTIDKDPLVKMGTDSEEARIFMTVNLPAVMKTYQGKITFNVDSDWEWNASGYYEYKGALNAEGKTDPLFTNIAFGNLTETEMEAIEAAKADLNIVVKAYAIQKNATDLAQLGPMVGDKLTA